ncbi:MAG: hypothetical protein KF778_12275 [Rhodocyclaceae bacterium]|nr:hypothetical protein [Rhodocyclaceae bacterium]MBX3669175.1 hypothetical protein [Rhodocyclaceae bacterium]
MTNPFLAWGEMMLQTGSMFMPQQAAQAGTQLLPGLLPVGKLPAAGFSQLSAPAQVEAAAGRAQAMAADMLNVNVQMWQATLLHFAAGAQAMLHYATAENLNRNIERQSDVFRALAHTAGPNPLALVQQALEPLRDNMLKGLPRLPGA